MPASKIDPATTPVILAIGEFTQKIDDFSQAQEPVTLMAQAMRACETDLGAAFLDRLEQISVIGIVSWRYRDPSAALCDALSISPKSKINAGMGGEKPVRLLHEAALAIQNGDAQAIAVAGGEAENSFRKARRAKVRLDWTERASVAEAWMHLEDTSLGINPMAQAIGVQRPAQIYPFFENALTEKRGQTPAEAISEGAEIWRQYSAAAAKNFYAWNRSLYDAKDIATISAHNRMVCFPYPKLMVANDSVNQAAAIVVTSLAFAKSLGVDDDKLVYFKGGAAANEPLDFLTRPALDECPAMTATLDQATTISGGATEITHTELYSCFPVVPKLALDHLRQHGLDDSLAPTVTGGLTFFGGPMNNYMTHSACAMTRQLRKAPLATGLLYGQGGAMTKHHALVLSTTPPTEPLANDYTVQAVADKARGAETPLLENYEGPASIESYSVNYDRLGAVERGIVILRTPDNARLIAYTPAEDDYTISALLSMDASAVGASGYVSAKDKQMIWRLR